MLKVCYNELLVNLLTDAFPLIASGASVSLQQPCHSGCKKITVWSPPRERKRSRITVVKLYRHVSMPSCIATR